MNHLLKTNDITRNRADFLTLLEDVKTNIHIVAVDTDYFFLADENRKTYSELLTIKANVNYHEIVSIQGHDAFLIEFEQLAQILTPIFKKQKQQTYVSA
jgi:homoserine O-acetyltransferase